MPTDPPVDLPPGRQLPEHRVIAHNASVASENKIHDDDVARTYGFAGGLVPGVTVYAYMTHPVVAALGREWLERGTASVRLLKPFYEGDVVTVRATVASNGEAGPVIDLTAANAAGEVCATGCAALPARAGSPPPPGEFAVLPLPAVRPQASPEAFTTKHLGSIEEHFPGGHEAAAFLAEIGDDLPLYRGEPVIAHPGWLIRGANTVLSSNVLLGPWMHVSSEIEHFSTVAEGEPISTRGNVADVFERKGHRFVEVDVAIFASDERPVLRARHVAIYEPRRRLAPES